MLASLCLIDNNVFCHFFVSSPALPMHKSRLYRTFKNDLLPNDVAIQVRRVLVEQAATCLMNEAIYPGPPQPPHAQQLQVVVMDERSQHIGDFLRELSVVVDRRYKAGGEEVTLKVGLQLEKENSFHLSMLLTRLWLRCQTSVSSKQRSPLTTIRFD